MLEEKIKSVYVKIYGNVQGVGFRYSTLQKAKNLEITGYVKNHQDGTVEVIAEAEESKLNTFLKWLKNGPPGSRVTNTQIQYKLTPSYYKTFSIEY